MRRLLCAAILLALLGLAGSAAAVTGPAPGPGNVVNGGDAAPGAFPFAVQIIERPGNGLCGGSVIGAQWVLTAAHCLHDPNTFASYPASRLDVIVGRSRLSGTDGEVVPIAALLPDNRYVAGTFRFDLALIRLSRPVGVPGVRMVRPGEEAIWAPGVPAAVAGWGATESAGASDALRQATIPIASDGFCQSAYAAFSVTFLSQVMLCTGRPEGGAAECSGDSGGPLTVSDGPGGAVLVGVVSWSRKPCGAPGNPGVYTRLGGITGELLAYLRTDPVAPVAAAGVEGGDAGQVGPSGAVVSGTVETGGLATRVRVEFGTTAALGQVTPWQHAGNGGRVPVSVGVGGLAPSTAYSYRLVADNALGTAPGATRALTTAAAPAATPAPTTPASRPSRRCVVLRRNAASLARRITRARAALRRARTPVSRRRAARQVAALRARRAGTLRAARTACRVPAARSRTAAGVRGPLRG